MSKITVSLTVDLPEVEFNNCGCALNVGNNRNTINCNEYGCKYCFFEEDNYKAIREAMNHE